MRERPKKQYEVVNIRPAYATQEEAERAAREAVAYLYPIFKKYGMLRPATPEELEEINSRRMVKQSAD